MTKQEIIYAILNNENVHWSNTGYDVIYNNSNLYVIFRSNGYMTALQESEYKDCFIGD